MSIVELKNNIVNFINSVGINNSLIIITGPTGVGKTEVANEIAKWINGVIINCDSVQIYNELKIMSARPNFKNYLKKNNYLFGIKSLTQEFSVGQWLDLLNNSLKDIEKFIKAPILVGGSGMYIDAALNGISPIPFVKNDLKKEAEKIINDIGISNFRKFVTSIDRNYSSKNDDKQRLLRAFNVFVSTGQNMTYWHAKEKLGKVNRKTYIVLITSNRKKIYMNCDNRFDIMMKKGGVEEVKKIWLKKYSKNLPGLKSLGVRRLLEYFDNKISFDLAVKLGKKDTRNYVKRQITWFKKKIVPNYTLYV